MANINCDACEDLRQEVPSLVTNGLSSTMCASLKNDTGLKASSGNDDCEDLNTMNDCLVGNMDAELDKTDLCDWKDYMKKFVPNVWTTLKAMICAICGIWTNIHDLWATIRSLCLKKSGNEIVLYSNLGDHCSVTDDDTQYHLEGSGTHTIHLKGTDGSDDTFTIPDENTWQKNTSTQDGYVTKGEDDPLKVWCTNNNGVPAWRNSPTLGGHITLMDHDGYVGETNYMPLETVKSISNDSVSGGNAKIKMGTLTKGTWVCAATIGYEPNATGVRGLGISFGNASHRKGILVPACGSGSAGAHETILCKTYIHTVTDATEDVYLDTYQDSGSSLNLLVAPETYVNCVRIE